MAVITDPIEDYYELGELLGEGKFSKVYLATRKEDGALFAVKDIDKFSVDYSEAMLEREVAILQAVDHPNIIRLEEVFDSPDSVYMVMEYVTGGELFDQIVDRGYYAERDAAVVMKQIVEAVKLLHDRGIVHRDLKPENLLCADDRPDAEVKIADFGLSKIVGGDVVLATACGTPGYVAPEVLTQAGEGYSKEVDIWSCGVVLYILLVGFPPFHSDNVSDLFAQIIEGAYDFPEPYFDDVSEDAKDLISKILVVDPAERLTCEEILEHPWIQGNAPDEQLPHFHDEMKKWNARRRLKSAIHTVLATNRLKSLVS